MNERISNLEKRTLKILYKRYKSYHKIEPILAEDLFRLLKIKDGEHVGLLNSSKYLSMKLVGTHEAFVINNAGIRYMESKPKWYEKLIDWLIKLIPFIK
jgi:hypothetical protein